MINESRAPNAPLLRRWLAIVLAGLLGVLVASAPGLVAPRAAQQIRTYLHGNQAVVVAQQGVSTLSGALKTPPDHAAFDRWSHVASGRPGGPTAPTMYDYDNGALLLQGAGVETITVQQARQTNGGLSSPGAGHVAANSGNRVFWSGGQPAKEAAEAFAKANGSKTLEMTAVGRTLEKLPYNRFTAKLWDAASAGFAVTARGNANVFIGPSFRGAGSTFGRIEGPILRFKGNPILQRFEDVW